MPSAIYTPPPPKKTEKKKPRIGVGMLSAFDEMEEAGETSASGSSAPLASMLLPQDFAEIEDASRKPQHPPGRLSQGTLSALLRVQELK
jgi:hypothetical protein